MPTQEFEFLRINAPHILSHPTWDLMLIFALLGAGFFYGITAGKRRIAATIIYTYVALAVSSALPLENWVETSSDLDKFWIQAGAFLGLFFFLAFILASRRNRGLAPASSWWQIFLLSFLQVGMLLHLILKFLPEDKIKLLAPLTKTVFANPDFHIWWLILPLSILVLLRRLESREE